MENSEKLATELLSELKASAKRWFIIALAELAIIISMVVGFLWYISLPIDESTTTEQTMDDVDVDGGSAIQKIVEGGN